MRRAIVPLAVLVIVAAAAATSAGSAGAAGASSGATLVAIRAAHHRGFDRLVFEFQGELPQLRTLDWGLDPPTLDPSGLPSGVQGNAFLSITFGDAVGHRLEPPFRSTCGPARRAYDLPNLAHLVQLGDWEAVLSFAVGVMWQPTRVRVTPLSGPPRWVIDIGTGFARRTVRVWYRDGGDGDGATESVVAVNRQVPQVAARRSALHRLFAGPTLAERAAGIRFVRSGATGFRQLRVSDAGVARVRLTGGCRVRPSQDVTIATELVRTLRALPRVEWVKIYDPAGTTQHPRGQTDSVPACLET